MRFTTYLLLLLLSVSIMYAGSISNATPNKGSWAGWSIYGPVSNPNLYTVNSINGSWIVQNTTPTSTSTFGSQWIGIGGLPGFV